ncbi:MAG: TIGR03842 family LLM class F420-dependent oxidoreductase, partial [Acidimicrobiales bacterium]
MDFGIVLQTDPPAWRTVDLAVKAESYGFSHAWTFDSHVLWQEPYVIYSAILARTNRIVVGPMVTNPGTRDWTVLASLHATLNDMYGDRTIIGIGRGDSALRVIGRKPYKLASMAEAIQVVKELGEGGTTTYNETELKFPWAGPSKLPILGAGYGPKALKMIGETCDGFILQLADPQIAKWTIEAVKTSASDAGR